MKPEILLVCCLIVCMSNAYAAGVGLPSRDPMLDVMQGFKNPPPGYGEVPYWWWTGDKLDVDRMIVQLRKLHEKGISGVQVNYSHHDSEGWLTDQDTPAIFSDEWWKVYSRISLECSKLNMGIGLSTYTIDWPRGAKNLFYDLFYSKAELNAIELQNGDPIRVNGGETRTINCAANQFAARAYKIENNLLIRGGVDLAPIAKDGKITWTAPPGEWEIWTFLAVKKAGSMNPLMQGMGETVIKGFFQQFQDHNPGKSTEGLNYFFNDELDIGAGKYAWNSDFPEEFARRKGYSLMDVLPAMWTDMGSITPKVRMDYADVRMSLMEERYFKPIYDWHASRGMIYACDSGGRGTNPAEFGDYFRATRWYSAPGHDTPGGSADLIKGKVDSSIANLYQRQRVWLEGYHSLGWGATPERLMYATRENYLYGCTLLNLHGLYYTTYGSFWEWAPPCYHFRMPYWAHMDVFLTYFNRLSYLMSQGHFVADVAVVYPVAPYEADMNGSAATQTAFELAHKLMEAGINFEFIDNDSIARATVEKGRLVLKGSGGSYQALIVPDMEAVRWPTIQKAAAFAKGGGKVYCVGSLPKVSDHAGRDDAELTALNDIAFKPSCRLAQPADAVNAIKKAFAQDVQGLNRTVRALHRRIGPREVYMVMDASPNSVVEFRAKGAVTLLDPWTGASRPLRVVAETATGTQVELPLESYEAQIVLFTPGKKQVNPPARDTRPDGIKNLPQIWNIAFLPTMDNSYGDFRIPVTPDNKIIGVEARRFSWARENAAYKLVGYIPGTDVMRWDKKLNGYGAQFYILGPVPEQTDFKILDTELSKLTRVDPEIPVQIQGKTLNWKPYDISFQYGKEGDPGHQGYHGLKRTITDDFLCLGKAEGGLNETRYLPDGGRYYIWTAATLTQDTQGAFDISREAPPDKSHTSPILTPAVVYVNGQQLSDISGPVALKSGSNPILARYDQGGRGHFVLRKAGAPLPTERQPLSMRWANDHGFIPFDVTAGSHIAEWFRFVSAPGTSAIRLTAHGTVEAWIDGKPMKSVGNGRFTSTIVPKIAAVVALRIQPETGYTGGAILPEPVVIETDGTGTMALGDWSQLGVLNNYSGGAKYSTHFILTKKDASSKVTLDLGRVAGTAEVHLNGRKVGIIVAPPWKLNVTGFLKSGENSIEVLVYNTLSNHYQTIPSNYRGDPISGLLGPVRLHSHDWKVNTSDNGIEPQSMHGVRAQALPGSLTMFDSKIKSNDNLAIIPGMINTATSPKAHDGGGVDYTALFNGTAGNGIGGKETKNDGKTFVGFGEGNTLDITFDPVLAPFGVSINAILNYAGHADARASQCYEVFASSFGRPDNFIKLADVAHDAPSGGLNVISIQSTAGPLLVKNAAALRFVFKDGPAGFNVYREISILGKPAKR